MCMVDEGDGWAVFRSVERRAAKDHRCDECYRTIGKGERYEYVTGLCNGWDYWTTVRTCAHCVEAKRWLVVACGGYLYEGTKDDLGEHVDGYESELRSAPLTRLVRWQRAEWLTRAGDLRPVEDVKAVTDRAIAKYREQYAKAVAA